MIRYRDIDQSLFGFYFIPYDDEDDASVLHTPNEVGEMVSLLSPTFAPAMAVLKVSAVVFTASLIVELNSLVIPLSILTVEASATVTLSASSARAVVLVSWNFGVNIWRPSFGSR